MTEQPEPTPKAPYIPDEMTNLIVYLLDVCEVLEQAKVKHEKYYRDAVKYLDHVKRASRDLDLVRKAPNEGGQVHRQLHDELHKRQREASDKPWTDDDVRF
jgi:hypothetical protein